MSKEPGQTTYEAFATQSKVIKLWPQMHPEAKVCWAAAEAAAAAKAVEPFELLGSHSVAMLGRTVVIEYCKGRMTVTDEMTEKFGEGATVTAAATHLCIQLGLLPPESGR